MRDYVASPRFRDLYRNLRASRSGGSRMGNDAPREVLPGAIPNRISPYPIRTRFVDAHGSCPKFQFQPLIDTWLADVNLKRIGNQIVYTGRAD